MAALMTHPTIEYADPQQIADLLDQCGVVALDDAVPTDWLTQARTAVEDLLRKYGEHDHFIRSPQGDEHSAVEAFISSPSVMALLNELVAARFPDGTAEPELTGTALRVIAGPKGVGDAWWFHYDASVVTMIVPLFIPDAGSGNSGELVGFFNKRPFRRFVIANIIGKAVSQSRFYRWLILHRFGAPNYGQIVDMKVGNIYLLWGYRSLHANMPCEAGAVRATLLLHFGRPHGLSPTLHRAVRLQNAVRGLRATAAHRSDAIEQVPS